MAGVGSLLFSLISPPHCSHLYSLVVLGEQQQRLV